MTDTLHEGMPDFLSENVTMRLADACKEALGYNLANFLQGPVFREEFVKAIFPAFLVAAEEAVDGVAACVRACTTALFEKHFPVGTIAPSVVKEVKSLFQAEVEARVKTAKAVVGRVFAAEKRCTYTNNHYLAQTIAKFKEIVVHNSGQWKKSPRDTLDGVNDGGDLVTADFMSRTAQSFRSESNDSAAVRDMQVALHAYGKVVHKRFTDTVAVVVFNELVYELIDATPRLSTEWAPRVLSNLAEEKKLALRRRELTKSVSSLETAMAEVDALE
jgi:hypothetical protein